MNVREIENAARLAWPALEEEELPFGVLRYARGLERRTNALSLYPDVDFAPMELIGAAEKFFGDRSASTIVRIVRAQGSSLAVLAELDSVLESRGYVKQSPTLTMLLDLAGASEIERSVESEPAPAVDLRSWLRDWYALTGRPLEGIETHTQILEKLERTNLRLLEGIVAEVSVATGMGVLSDRAIGLFGIATASDHRHQGHASAVLSSLLHWAVMRGARYAYLQVEESNLAAISLYRKLGFAEIYSYWYRVGQTVSTEGVVK